MSKERGREADRHISNRLSSFFTQWEEARSRAGSMDLQGSHLHWTLDFDFKVVQYLGSDVTPVPHLPGNELSLSSPRETAIRSK